ncbi:hypothetical protein ACUXPM_003894 [Ralstonia sp. 151470066-2]|jgi:hypothetical protein|nr:hypothetical protein [Ralstonia insidiosa]MBA9938693.1 hypothetical protein [Ralstonia insidiosa]
MKANWQLIGSILIFLLPILAWILYEIGRLIDRVSGRPTVNGASVYNWLSLAAAFVIGWGAGPDALGVLIVALIPSWIVATRLSKKYRGQKLSVSNQR